MGIDYTGDELLMMLDCVELKIRLNDEIAAEVTETTAAGLINAETEKYKRLKEKIKRRLDRMKILYQQ